MKERVLNVCDIYNKSENESIIDLYDYNPMIYSFGNILFKVDESNYQGDTYVLYGNIFGSGRVGFLNFGWGSCSGCDALQACSTWEEVQDLYDELKSSIKWFDDIKKAYLWFCSHDWKGDYSTIEKKRFVKIATNILETLVIENDKERGNIKATFSKEKYF